MLFDRAFSIFTMTSVKNILNSVGPPCRLLYPSTQPLYSNPIRRSKLSARKMIGFVTLVWVLAFFIAVPQVTQTYAPWPDDFKDVICPLSAVSERAHLSFLLAAKPRMSLDNKYEVGGKGVLHFLVILCQYGKTLTGI